MLSDSILAIPDTNTARQNHGSVPDFGSNYVQQGGRVVVDYDGLTASVDPFTAIIVDSGTVYRCEVDSRKDNDTLSLTANAVNDVYYQVSTGTTPLAGELIATTGSEPAPPSLKIAEIDTSGETVTDKSRSRSISFGSATFEESNNTKTVTSANAQEVIEEVSLGRGIAHIPAGETVSVETVLQIPDDTKLKIDGTLEAADGLDRGVIENADKTNGNSNIRIFGSGTIDGRRDNQSAADNELLDSAILFMRGDNYRVEGIDIINAIEHGVMLTGPRQDDSYDSITNYHINNLTTINSQDGIHVEGLSGEVTGCLFQDGRDTGCAVDNAKGLTVGNNTALSTRSDFAFVQGFTFAVNCEGATYDGNTVIGNGEMQAGFMLRPFQGGTIEQSEHAIVSDNYIEGITGDANQLNAAIVVKGQNFAQITDNYIFDTRDGARGIASNRRCEITGNTLVDIDGDGIYGAPGTTECTVNNNTIRNPARNGGTRAILWEGDLTRIDGTTAFDSPTPAVEAVNGSVYVDNSEFLTVADTDNEFLAAGDVLTTEISVFDETNDQYASFALFGDAGAVTKLSDPSGSFSTNSANAGTSNVFWGGGQYEIVNRTGAEISYKINYEQNPLGQ